jgi:hypothetical protein
MYEQHFTLTNFFVQETSYRNFLCPSFPTHCLVAKCLRSLNMISVDFSSFGPSMMIYTEFCWTIRPITHIGSRRCNLIIKFCRAHVKIFHIWIESEFSSTLSLWARLTTSKHLSFFFFEENIYLSAHCKLQPTSSI